MKPAPVPKDELQRLTALRSYNILDTASEQGFDDISYIASQICNTPIALVSLIDEDRQWFKSKQGITACETHRDFAFCAHAIHFPAPFIIEDTLEDDRFTDNPLVTGPPDIRFYAGMPLITPDGYALGTLCVIDTRPRSLSHDQLKILTALARQVVAQLELRKQSKQLALANSIRERLITILTHDLKNSFQVVAGYARRLRKKKDVFDSTQVDELAGVIENSAIRAHELLIGMVAWSKDQLNSETAIAAAVDLQDACQKAISLCEPLAKAKEINITLLGSVDSPVLSNKFLLVSTLQNLLSNSIKFSHIGYSVEVTVGSQGDMATCTVTDHGEGMEQADAEKLFDGSISKSKSGTLDEIGFGIGSLLISDFVKSYRGTLSVDAAPEKGMSVTIAMPKLNDIKPQ